ncbi:MAG TPA: hypothetical protein VEC12_09850, partial [Bacteroidia bacterium]|nr:hypothetical protein [Bacteroidia bacterium]
MSIIAGPDIIQMLDVVCYELPQMPGWNFNWTVSANGMILSSNNKNSIVVKWLTPGGGSVAAIEPGGPTNLFINVVPPVGIFGPTQAQFSEPATYFIPYNTGFTYSWQTGGGGAIISPSNENAVVVQWNGIGNQQIMVSVNGGGFILLNVYVNMYTAINTRSIVNYNDISTASLNPGFGTIPLWGIYGGGNIIAAGTGDCAATWNGIGQSVLFAEDNINNVSYCQPVYVLPALPISGPSEVQTGEINVYSVSHTGGPGTPYQWLVSANGNIESGINSNTACINWLNPGYTVLMLKDINSGILFKHIKIDDTFINGASQGVDQESYLYSINAGSANYQWGTFGSVTPALSTINDLFVAGLNPGVGLIWAETAITRHYKIVWSESALINGPATCNHGELATYWMPYSPGEVYTWSVIGGEIEEVYENKVKIQWTNTGANVVVLRRESTGETLALPISVIERKIDGIKQITAGTSLYNVTDTLNADTFNWYKSNNTATFIGAVQDVNHVNIQHTAGTNWVVAVDANNNSYAGVIRVYDIPQPDLSGPAQACANGPVAQYSSPYADSDFMYWLVSGGEITNEAPGQITVQWNSEGTGTVTLVQANDATSIPDELQVSLKFRPEPQIIGSANIVAGKIETYSAASTENQYNWIVVGGNLISGQGTSSILVLWPTSTAKYNGSVTLEESNSYCDAEVDQLNTIVSPVPVPEIQGNIEVCEQAVHNYSVFNSGNSFLWEVEGGTIVSGQDTHLVSVQWNDMLSNSKGKVKITETNINSVSASTELVVDVFVIPSPVIAGPETVGTTGISVYEVYNTGNIFTWSVTNGTILSGQGTSRIEVQWSSVTTQTGGEVEVEEECPVCASNPVIDTKDVVIVPIPNPVITGDDIACTESTKTYTTPNHGNHITWEVVGGEVTDTLSNPPGIEVKWHTTSEKIYGYVKAVESSPYTSPGTVSSLKEVKIVPVAAPNVTGPQEMLAGSYSAYKTPASGNNFSWSLPSGGGIIEAGQGTNCICVKWNDFTGGPNLYTVEVIESNGVCSTDDVPVEIEVTLYDNTTVSFSDLQRNITLTRIGRDSLLENIILKNERIKVIDDELFILDRQERPLSDPKREELVTEKEIFFDNISEFTTAVEFNNNLLDGYLTAINADTPAELIVNHDRELPHALFPVRLETKFKKFDDDGIDKYKIRVRIYPDDLMVHTHEESLTPWEINTAKDYWGKVWLNNTEQSKREAWAHVAKRFSSQRASWIIQKLTPVNISQIGTDPNPLFPVPDVKTSSWT